MRQLQDLSLSIGRFAWLAIGALSLVAAIAAFWPPLNHDVAACLYYAMRMADGARLYVDISDVNPPLVFWLDLAPAFLAKWTQLPATTLFAFLVLIAALLSLALTRAILRRSNLYRAPAALIAVACLATLLLPGYSFGQREHLMLILCLPYLALGAARLEGRDDAIAATSWAPAVLMAAAGLFLKPHFLGIPLLIELAVLARHGLGALFGPPALPMLVLLGLAYAGSARLIHPAYFATVVPDAIDWYGRAESSDWAQLFAVRTVLTPLVLLLAGSALAIRGGSISRIAILAGWGAFAAGLSQARGWDYHFLAALGFAMVALGADAASRPPQRLVAAFMPVALLAVALGWSPLAEAQRRYRASPAAILAAYVRSHAQGAPVLWLTSSIYPQFPGLLYAGSRLNLPVMSLWLLPEIYASAERVDGEIAPHRWAEMPRAERRLFDATVALNLKQPPALIIAVPPNRVDGFSGARFDYLTYFAQEPDFAQLLSRYRALDPVVGLTILARVDLADAYSKWPARLALASK